MTSDLTRLFQPPLTVPLQKTDEHRDDLVEQGYALHGLVQGAPLFSHQNIKASRTPDGGTSCDLEKLEAASRTELSVAPGDVENDGGAVSIELVLSGENFRKIVREGCRPFDELERPLRHGAFLGIEFGRHGVGMVCYLLLLLFTSNLVRRGVRARLRSR